MAVVIFDPAAFKARYVAFASVADATLAACFTEAGLYLSNANNSPVQDVTRRAMLLNMLTAHIAYIGGVLSADGMARPVGRLTQAGEGSVSASFEGAPPGSAQWFQQSQWGSSFWQATSSLRGFRYRAQPTIY
ncbi:MAG: DUF4054 domain-containing protein [Polaromonas sp.]|nr:DUF4054 domain-containing protein [Polaromonas sp.]